MSIRLNGASPALNTAGLAGRAYPGGFVPVTEPWVRNPSWPACEADPGDNKIVGLYAVWPGDGVGNGGNFFAVTISGAYTIDYGDGTTTNYTSGSTAYYEFDYNDADLAGTDAPVTLTASTDTVDRTAHGYTDGMTVSLYNIVTTTGVSEGQQYYVVNATANTFQVATTPGGSAIDLVGDGSATLLPYKIATVTITPQAGVNLTNINLFVKHNQTSLANGYSTGWLDIAIAASTITQLTIGGLAVTVRHNYLERVRLNELGAITSFTNLFRACYALRSVYITDSSSVTNTSSMFEDCFSLTEVPLFDTSSVTNTNNMFDACYSLTEVPPFNTASVTAMSNMFVNCRSLKTVPLFDTASVTIMSNMFGTCYVLTQVPLFNTASVTNMSSMFSGCVSLKKVPLFNTSSVTTMSTMLASCYSLKEVPLFNTSSVTDMGTMLSGCFSLTEIPLFDTSSVTNMGSMFNNCTSLKTVPLFNTVSVTNMGSMFSGCYSLEGVPLFNSSAVTTMASMFNDCHSLQTVPLLDTSSVTSANNMFRDCFSLSSVPALDVSAVTSSSNFSNMFTTCNSLSSIKATGFNYTFSVASCKLSSAALDEIYTNLPTVVGQTITVTGNYGTTGDDPLIATAKGWTVVG